MTDDELIQKAGEAAREDDPLADPRWDALAAGTLSEQDRAELRALAERSPAAKAAYEALQPLGEAERERLVDGILAAPAAGKVIPLTTRRRRVVGAVAAALSLAAAVTLLALPRGGSGLPGYQVTIVGEQAQRSHDAGGETKLGPGSRLELVLRPEVAVQGPVAARGFLFQGGAGRPWDAPIEIAEGGAIRIAGTYESLFAGAPPGLCELIIAIGRPGALPRDPEAVAAARREQVGSRNEAWQLVRVPLLLVDRERSQRGR